MSKVRVKFNTNVWDNAQTLEGGKETQTFFTEGMVADVYETKLILDCFGAKTAERVNDNTPLVSDPGQVQETPQEVEAPKEVETPQKTKK